jgi:hypothetical protein
MANLISIVAALLIILIFCFPKIMIAVMETIGLLIGGMIIVGLIYELYRTFR